MASTDLAEFLEDTDIEDYVNQFIQLGCKKLKHVKDIETEHLVGMGMKPLEIKRFLAKQNELFSTSSEDNSNQNTSPCSPKAHKSVHVPLPSTVFGQGIHEDESKLIKKYSELYYVSPMNLKQEYNNSFILKMCSAAEWRFNSKKKDLLTWGRAEREDRWKCYLSLIASTDSLQSQSNHFKQQSLVYQVEKLKNENLDLLKMNDILKESKQNRVECLAEQTSTLLNWCELGIKMISDKIKETTGKTSRREEMAWWNQIFKPANEVKMEIIKFNENIQSLKNKFEERFGPSTSKKASKKGTSKNIQKGLKRKLGTEIKLAGSKRKAVNTGETRSLHTFFSRKSEVQQATELQTSVLLSFCIRYRCINSEDSKFF